MLMKFANIPVRRVALVNVVFYSRPQLKKDLVSKQRNEI